MREILFRGKTESGKWVEGAYYHQTEFYGDSIDASYIISSKDVLEDNMMIFCEVIPETVGQYTGLTDKNGKKIFEGDILAYEIRYPHRVSLGVVCAEEWNCSCCNGVFGYALAVDNDLRDHNRCEIIGNIHDNPELVKGGESE